jgi:hypothetical protein
MDRPNITYFVQQVPDYPNIDWIILKRYVDSDGREPCPLILFVCTGRCPVFTGANKVMSGVYGAGVGVNGSNNVIGVYHSGSPKADVDYYMEEWAKGALSSIKILFATEVCARGKEWPLVDIVVQFQPGQNLERCVQLENRARRDGQEGRSLHLLLWNHRGLRADICDVSARLHAEDLEKTCVRPQLIYFCLRLSQCTLLILPSLTTPFSPLQPPLSLIAE